MSTIKFTHPQIKSTWPRCKKCGDAYFDYNWRYIYTKEGSLADGVRVCQPCFNHRWWEEDDNGH